MRATLCRLTSIAACCFIFSLSAGAAETYTFSDVTFDDATGIVSSVGRTEPDYTTLFWYARVWAAHGVRNAATGTVLAQRTADAYNTPAEVRLQVEGDADEEYEAGTVHYMASTYYVYNYYSQGQYYSGYRDYYNYGQYEGQNPIVYGGFTFTASGPEMIRYSSNRYLGETKKKVKIGTPHHLWVVSDVIREGLCGRKERRITYQVVDVNNRKTGRTPVRELFPGEITDSCTGITFEPTSCQPKNSDGSFTDVLHVGVPTASGSCPPSIDENCGALTDPNKWQWCPTGRAAVTLATFTYETRWNRIGINGRFTEWPGGGQFFP